MSFDSQNCILQIIFRTNSTTLYSSLRQMSLKNLTKWLKQRKGKLFSCLKSLNVFYFIFLFGQNNVTISRHQTLEQRCNAAKLMLDSVEFHNCAVMVDNIDDEANKAYAGMPIRLYIIKNQEIEYAGGTGPTFYNPNEVKRWLQSTRTSVKNTRHRA